VPRLERGGRGGGEPVVGGVPGPRPCTPRRRRIRSPGRGGWTPPSRRERCSGCRWPGCPCGASRPRGRTWRSPHRLWGNRRGGTSGLCWSGWTAGETGTAGRGALRVAGPVTAVGQLGAGRRLVFAPGRAPTRGRDRRHPGTSPCPAPTPGKGLWLLFGRAGRPLHSFLVAGSYASALLCSRRFRLRRAERACR